MTEKPILIADGHHRYETSLMYKNNYSKESSCQRPEEYVLTLFVDSSQEDIKIYPTHRRIRFKKRY